MSISPIIKTKSYEKVVFVLRRHSITFIPYIAMFVVLLVIPIGVYAMFAIAFENLMQNPIFVPAAILAASAYFLSILLFFYSSFVEFYLDTWIITNDRLVDVRQISLFARTISEVDLYQIQDVTTEVKGFFPSIFNYGNIYLQTAGPVPKFILYNVPNPDQLRQAIIELASQDKQYHK